MSRKPPHDVGAEEALIGSMLLTRDAVETGLSIVDEADYYTPGYGAIHTAVARLDARGAAVDPVTVAALLTTHQLQPRGGWQHKLLEIQAAAPASVNARHYALIVAERAVARRAIQIGDDLTAAGFAADLEQVNKIVGDAEKRLGAPLAPVEGIELEDLLADDTTEEIKPWLIHGLLRVRERYILTGKEGWGKSTLIRQMAMGIASGVHPFLNLPRGVERNPVLILDLQEDEPDLRAAFRPLRKIVGDAYERGYLTLRSRPQGLNLLDRGQARWFESLIASCEPALVCISPLRKLYRGQGGQRKWDEELVEELQAILDELRIRYDFALMIEGHAGHDRDTWRVRGSSLWYDWPEFGHGLAPNEETSTPAHAEVEIRRWRGDRHYGRPWPNRLYKGAMDEFPWTVSTGDRQQLLKSAAAELFNDWTDEQDEML